MFFEWKAGVGHSLADLRDRGGFVSLGMAPILLAAIPGRLSAEPGMGDKAAPDSVIRQLEAVDWMELVIIDPSIYLALVGKPVYALPIERGKLLAWRTLINEMVMMLTSSLRTRL